MTELDIQNVFNQFSLSKIGRLVRSINNRERTRFNLQNGVSVESDPKVTWLLACSNELISLISDEAEEYNRDNPTDLISVQDLIDLLQTTEKRIKTTLEKSEQFDFLKDQGI